MATTEEEMQAVFTDFLQGVVTTLQQYLQANNRNATGRTSASIRLNNVTFKGGQVVGNENVFYTFFGRKPGKMPPISAIADWCSARGIPRGAAYAIAKKIADEGTKLYKELQQSGVQNNAISLATRKELIDRALQSVQQIYNRRIQSDLINAAQLINQ